MTASPSTPRWVGRALWLAAFLLYVWAAAPGVEWLDAGELVAGGWSLGVAHPPGEPGYALLVRLVSYLPIGEVAFRVNVLSAAGGAWLVLGVYYLALALAGRSDGRSDGDDWPAIVGAATAALTVALSPILVEQATRAEVYAPAAALVIWASRFGVRFVRGEGVARDALVAAFLLALAVSIHPLVAAAVGLPFAAAVAWKARRRLRRLAPWTLAVGALGLLVLAYLPIRAHAAARPLLVWGEPGTWGSFRAVVSGAAYGQNFAAAGFAGRFVAHLKLLGEGTGLACLFAGVAGLLFGALTRLRGAAVILAATAAVVAGAAVQRVFYPVNPDVHGYLLPGLALVAAGIVALTVAAARLLRSFDARVARFGWLLALVPVLALAAAGPRIHVRDGGFRRADDALAYWDETVGRMPAGPGVYFANSDHALFPAWYERIVAGARPDVAVANDGLVTSSWFLRMIDRELPALFVPYVDDGGRRDRLAYRLAADNAAAGRPVGSEWPLDAPPGEALAATPQGLGFRITTIPTATPPAEAAPPAPLPSYEGDIGRRVAGHVGLLRAEWELGGGIRHALPRREPVFIFEDWQADLIGAWHALLLGSSDAEHQAANAVIAAQGPAAEVATARLLARRGREAEAIARMEALAPRDPEAALLLAALIGNTGAFSRAEELLRGVIAAAPRNARAHAQLGLVLAKTNRLDEAMAEWRTSLAIEPGQPDVNAWLAAAERQPR